MEFQPCVLKACPFCGTANPHCAVAPCPKGIFEGTWFVECVECTGSVTRMDTREEAEIAWNRRT